MDLEFTAVTRAGVHMPDRERAGEPAQYASVQPAGDYPERVVRFRRLLGEDAGLGYLFEYLIHRLTDLRRYS